MGRVLKGIRQEAYKLLFYRGKKPIEVEVKDIGNEWQEFTGNGDHIRALESDRDNVTVYLYKCPANFEFPTHYHKNTEYISFLEGSATYEFLDDGGNYHKGNIVAGESISFAPNIPHKFFFEKDSFLQITYHPSFEGDNWTGLNSEI